VFRHLYSFEIEWEKERLVAGKFPAAVQQFREEIMGFIRFIRSLEK
jgi:hypothetical protein